jgi:opacity protein-like surface antigen
VKNHLLALMTAATTLIGAQSQADELNLNGFYVGAFGGGNFLSDYHHHGVKTSFDAGYLAGGNIGYSLDEGMRVEGEFTYRNNKINCVRCAGQKNKHLHTHLSTYSLMANGYYDFNCGLFDIKPYVGGGIGYAWNETRAQVRNIHVVGKDKGFAWQAMAGASYNLYCNVKVNAEYRFFKTLKHINDQAVIVGLELAL